MDAADVVVRAGRPRCLEALGLVVTDVAGVELVSLAVIVWSTESLLVTATTAPGGTLSVIGENMKFEMVIV